MAEPTVVRTGRRMLLHESGRSDACFVFVENTESDTIPFLFQGEPQVNRFPTAEARDGSDIADPSPVSEGSATQDEGTR